MWNKMEPIPSIALKLSFANQRTTGLGILPPPYVPILGSCRWGLLGCTGRVGRGERQPRIHQSRVQQLCALESSDGFWVLAVLEALNALVECFARLSLILSLWRGFLTRQAYPSQFAQENQKYDHEPGANTSRKNTASSARETLLLNLYMEISG